MKKTLLSVLALLLVVSVSATAEPRFGIVGYDSGSAGVYVTDDAYSASLTYQSSDSDAASSEAESAIGLIANYKVAADSQTSLTAGVAYVSASNVGGTKDRDSTSLSLNVGIEYSLNSNLLTTAEVTVYSTTTLDNAAGSDDKTTAMFSGGRAGLVYLF